MNIIVYQTIDLTAERRLRKDKWLKLKIKIHINAVGHRRAVTNATTFAFLLWRGRRLLRIRVRLLATATGRCFAFQRTTTHPNLTPDRTGENGEGQEQVEEDVYHEVDSKECDYAMINRFEALFKPVSCLVRRTKNYNCNSTFIGFANSGFVSP